MRPLYWFWESEIPAEKCQEIIETHFLEDFVSNGTFTNNIGEQNLNDDTRITDIVWIAAGDELFDILFSYIQSANQNVWNYDLSGMESVQLSRYKEGGHYEWHSDSDDPCLENYQRKLSCTLQLSDEDSYEGGDLIFKNPNQVEEKAPRKRGSIIVFPSATVHKVSPVTSGVRYSAVSWMRGIAFK